MTSPHAIARASRFLAQLPDHAADGGGAARGIERGRREHPKIAMAGKKVRLALAVVIGLLAGGAGLLVATCLVAGVEPTKRRLASRAHRMYRIAVEARWQSIPGLRLTEGTSHELCLAALSHAAVHAGTARLPVYETGVCQGIRETARIERIDEAIVRERANLDGEYWYYTVRARPETLHTVQVTVWHGVRLSDARSEREAVLAGGGPVLSCSRRGVSWTCRPIGMVVS